MVQLADILTAIGKLSPWDLAETWDQVGMQIGRMRSDIAKIMVALELNGQVLEEGCQHGVQGFIVHHPLIFKPLTGIRSDTPNGQSICRLIQSDLFLITAHTNIDKAEHGLNQYLGELIGLKELEPLEPAAADLCKLVVFVPASHLDPLRETLAAAGAGEIGAYTSCSFSHTGEGTFLPGANAHPWRGSPGHLERTPEVRLEMIAAKRLLPKLIAVVTEYHPYEEPEIDFYPLLNQSRHGLGRMGNLPNEMTLGDLSRLLIDRLGLREIKITGASEKPVRRVALCSGSGHDLIQTALKRTADVYISADLGYHDFIFANENGLAMIDAGHWGTEHHFVPMMASYLQEYFPAAAGLNVISSQTGHGEPYRFIVESK